MGVLGRLDRYRGKSPPARRLRRRLRFTTRDRTVSILAGVLGTASVLSLLPGSVQHTIQYGVCKASTVGVGRCRPVDLDLPPLPLAPARCTSLAGVASAFPVVVAGSRRRFSDLYFDRIATSDGTVHWLPSVGAASSTGTGSGVGVGPVGAAVSVGDLTRSQTGPAALRVPLEGSWTFSSAERERAFAASVFASAAHQVQLRQLSSLAARFGSADTTVLPTPTESAAQVSDLPALPSSSGGTTDTPTRDLPGGAATATTTAEGGPLIGPDPAGASVSVDDVTSAPTTTVRLLDPAVTVPALASLGTSGPTGVMQLDDDTSGRISRVRIVLVDRVESRVELTFVDVRAGSDADAATLDRWASGAWGSTWDPAALTPLAAPGPDAAAWHQLFWSGGVAVRVVLQAPDAPTAIRASSSATGALDSWSRGYLGADLWQELPLTSVQQLGPVVGSRRAWQSQSGCVLDAAPQRGAAVTPNSTIGAVERTTLPAVRLRLRAGGCTPTAPTDGWEQSLVCTGPGNPSGYRVSVSSRVSALGDPALVGAALLSGRRTGFSAGTTLTGDVGVTWLDGAAATRLSFRTPTAGGDTFGVLVAGAVPGGGTGALLITAPEQPDPEAVQDTLAALSVAPGGPRR